MNNMTEIREFLVKLTRCSDSFLNDDEILHCLDELEKAVNDRYTQFFNKTIFVKCESTPGAFSDDMNFLIDIVPGAKYKSMASINYFKTEGYIEARLLEEIDGMSLVSLPDGEIVSISPDLIKRKI